MQTEENALEQALRRAVMEPAEYPAFLHLLLESDVFVWVPASPEPGDRIQIRFWKRRDGLVYLPFFSSLEAVQRGDALQAPPEIELAPLAVNARWLLTTTRGMPAALNPGSAYTKEFRPEELEAILSGGTSCLPVSDTDDGMNGIVMLSQPANYPGAMVASLTVLFSKYRNIETAYLALMHDASGKPSLIVGVEGEGDIHEALRDAATVADKTLAANPSTGDSIIFFRIRREAPDLSQYFIEKVKPFYERKWGSRLKSGLDPGHA